MLEQDTDGIGWCGCGAAWFQLRVYDDPDADPAIGAAVCINPEGTVTGYAGKLVCLECGADWTPGEPTPPPPERPLLRLIQGGNDG